MRIIRGKYKTRKLPSAKGFKARPTTDFAKENLFNVLDNRYYFEHKTVLDLFAGTGSMGIEFASRGCERVVSVEKNNRHYTYIDMLADKFDIPEVTAVRADAFRYIELISEQFNFVFADPPYDLKELSEIPDKIFNAKLLKPEGLFILEHPGKLSFNTHPNFKEHRAYGSVNFSFFEE